MEKKTEKKTSNLESNKTLKQAISISVDAIVKIKAKKRSAKEEAEKVAGEVGEARKRPLSQMSDAKSHRLPKMTGEKPAVPLAWSCSSGEGSVRLAPHSAKDEKKPAEQQAPPKKHRKRDSSKVNPRDPCKQAPKKQSQLFEVPIVPPNLETLPKYSRYAQEKFLLPVAIRGKKDLGINTLGSNLAKLRVWVSSRRPIIVVPQAVTSLITLHNAKEVLQHMHFVQSPLDAPPPEEVVIERDFPNGKTREYRIIDNVSKLCTDEWQRVIAVFALGPHRQFRGWPWKGDPAVIFRKVCVFHLHHQDVGVHKDLLEMAVHPLEISKNEPHTHGGILKEFWGTLDEYVRTQSQFSFLLEEGAYFALGCIPF
ncbi:uncharacterized protein LOC6592372 [Drosophila persimilis]|uniref:uncharacterized protein LOC6592372 n=1 Tax=Drosophila persimilis TaxID=7234 RepID=UPI000F08E8D0|nr:uncharacterized protein LOC6592372 [Drosophila persimilis]